MGNTIQVPMRVEVSRPNRSALIRQLFREKPGRSVDDVELILEKRGQSVTRNLICKLRNDVMEELKRTTDAGEKKKEATGTPTPPRPSAGKDVGRKYRAARLLVEACGGLKPAAEYLRLLEEVGCFAS